jgi:hypothetical protein
MTLCLARIAPAMVALVLALCPVAHALDGTLAVLPWTSPDAGALQPFAKECWLLAQNQDLALLLLPAGYPMPPALQALEAPTFAEGDYYLFLVEDPARADFAGETRVLYRRGRTVLLWSAGEPRLTPESRALQHGLVQPVRITLSPKAWPAVAEVVPSPGERTDFHPLVDQIVADVSQAEYVAKWQSLDDYETRYSYATQNAASAAWMHSVFRSLGLQARYHFFNMSGQRKNVVGIKPGLVHPERVVYITGHFDSTSEDNYNHAPGADDNASGTAAFLEAARVLSEYQFENTIKFVGFSGEEQGLVGSAAYVDSIAGAGEQVVGCFNADMIAYAGTDPAPPDLIIYTNSNSLTMAQLLRDACTEYYPTQVQPVVVQEAIGASDHASFWDHGYRAVLGIEEEAWGSDFCPWYHTSNDRIERYPQDYPTNCTGALIAAVAQTAVPLAPATPYLILDAVAISDDNIGSSQGNGNGVIEYGETIEVTLTLRNIGQQTAIGVTGQLQESDPFVTLLVGQAGFGNIPSGGTGSNATPFVYQVDAAVPDAHSIDFGLAVNQPPNTLAFQHVARAPDLQIVAYESSDVGGGDGDGIPEPGETVTLSITVTNQGSVGVTDCWGTLYDGPYCNADPTPRAYGALAPGGSAEGGPFTVVISPSCPELFTATLALGLDALTAYDRSDEFTFNIGDIFAADMEGGAAGWTHYMGGGSFTDQWHLETYRNHTYGGATSWKCGGNGSADYGNLLHAVLESPVFTLPDNSTLTFWHWIEAETSQSYPDHCYDGGLVQISIDGGAWQQIAPEGGYPYLIRNGSTPGPFAAETPVFSGSHGWLQETFDLAGFSGSARVRFVFGSDGADVFEGWYIDDAELILETQPAGVPEAVTIRLHPVRPNPALGTATLRLDLPRAADADVRVFDASGRQVRTVLRGRLPAGSHPLTWDGQLDGGRAAGAGIYWIRARADGREMSERVVLAR